MTTTSNGFKMEVDQDFKIKPDPEAGSPQSIMDHDVYEDDDGELIMPTGAPRGWLLRLPKDLWQLMADYKAEEDIQIGAIKVWKQKDGKQKFRFEINPNIPKTKMVPKQYDMMGSEQPISNTFVFSEKDLEGYKPRGFGRNNAANFNDPLKQLDSKNGNLMKVEKPRQKYRIIPKRTALVGGVDREFKCAPRDNEEFRAILAKKQQAEKEKHKEMKILSGQDANILHTEAMGIGANNTAFIQTGTERKKRTQENKATRMEEGPLTDMIMALFKDYQFYSMSVLRQKTKQPEAWLRQIMQKVGYLVKTGTAANTWTLNQLYTQMNKDIKDGRLKEDEALVNVKMEQIAPVDHEAEALEDDDEDMEDDSDEGDFEDV